MKLFFFFFFLQTWRNLFIYQIMRYSTMYIHYFQTRHINSYYGLTQHPTDIHKRTLKEYPSLHIHISLPPFNHQSRSYGAACYIHNLPALHCIDIPTYQHPKRTWRRARTQGGTNVSSTFKNSLLAFLSILLKSSLLHPQSSVHRW